MATRKTKQKEISQFVGEDDFVLKGKDWTTPQCILFWMAMNCNTISDEKMQSAFDKVMKTRKVIGRRNPD